MPYLEINNAKIFYQTFGQGQPGQSPILLIHGSTITGAADWHLVAPLLARRWQVIVPDCRGHGRSSNPGNSYRFSEMAADMAALVRGLGFERAHIIGHSNGGNVALVTLMEHPDIIQTAILQAANAYVSPDLIAREPVYFDPQRIEREQTAWMQEMIDLHGPTHGQDYWRVLVQITMQETIREPRYTAEDLQRVQHPVLVIQGENDKTNAPNRHGQFIAHNVDQAELWIPANVGHTVHAEVLFEWIEKVESFLDRRGTDENETLYRLGRQHYADERDTIFNLRATRVADHLVTIKLVGNVLRIEQLEAAQKSLHPHIVDTSAVQVLLDDAAPWALFQRVVTDLRRSPTNRAERVSQGLIGDAVRILVEQNDWAFVRMLRDGYMGWVHNSSLHRASQAEITSYLAEQHVRVVAGLLPASLSPATNPTGSDLAGLLPFGARLPVNEWRDNLASVRLPDGNSWWVSRNGLLQVSHCPQPDSAGIAFTLEQIKRFIGVPYLWGGCTPFGYDCSGLVTAFYGFMGLDLPRDADQQFTVGRRLDGAYQPGDLLFFGHPDPDQPDSRLNAITHVAISLGGDEFIHANGATWSTAYNSLNPAQPLYRPDLAGKLMGARRYT